MVLKTAIPIPRAIPDKDLPDRDGSVVANFAELPHVTLLTSAVRQVLDRRHPDGRYCIGGDSGIY